MTRLCLLFVLLASAWLALPALAAEEAGAADAAAAPAAEPQPQPVMASG